MLFGLFARHRSGKLFSHLSEFCGNHFNSGGNPKGAFGLAPVQGECKVFVKRPLDREEQDRYLLNITANDGLFVTRIGVEVTVMDANDNSPICNQVCAIDFRLAFVIS